MTTRGKLIGVVGFAGAGKTTVTREAIKLHDQSRPVGKLYMLHRNFSSPIYAMLAAMGIPQSVLNDKARWNEPLDMLCGHTTRYAATTLGTEWGRDHIGQDVWTRIALAEADRLRKIGHHVIIDNVRFPSEMEAMRKTEGGASFVAMYRNDTSRIQHDSERHIPQLQRQCECAVYNVGALSDAISDMREVIERLIR